MKKRLYDEQGKVKINKPRLLADGCISYQGQVSQPGEAGYRRVMRHSLTPL